MSDDAPRVAVRDLVHRYDDVVALRGISFEVRRGETFGLIGPDGAGKTTTLRCALGLLRPADGTVVTCGLDPWRRRRELSDRIGYLSQRFSLYGDLSIDENVAFFARLHGVRTSRALREELLGMLRLTPFRDRLADRLSGGMRQKLALACTLVHTPELLVLDEPTTGVDPVSRRDFWRILHRLQRDGLTLLLTTPYLDEAERCNRVGLLDHGRLLTVDAPDALRTGFPGVLLEVLAEPRRRAHDALRDVEGVTDVETFGERLHVRVEGADDPQAAVERVRERLGAAGVRVVATRPMPPSLEDVFIARIREADSAAGRPPEAPPEMAPEVIP